MQFKTLIETCERAIDQNTTIVLSIKQGSTFPSGFPVGKKMLTADKEIRVGTIVIHKGDTIFEFEAEAVVDWLYKHAMERKNVLLIPRYPRQ